MSYTRRDFTKLAALGAAAQYLPSAIAQAAAPSTPPTRKINYAVIGIGRIAGHFLPGTVASQYSHNAGLVSGHPDKAEKTAAQYGIPKENIYNYENFDSIAKNKSIDAVYVALPNSMHAEYTIRAAKAGKHVLCEKPMAINSAECQSMINACKANNVKLMIAYRLHYEPITIKLREIVRSGRIGELQDMQGANGFSIGLNEWRYNKALAGGGSLFDLGVYCINAFRYFSGEELSDPTQFRALFSTKDKEDPRFKEVEGNVSWLMRFPSGTLATGACSYEASMENLLHLNGTKGSLAYGPYGYSGQYIKGVCRESAAPGAKPVVINETSPEQDPMQFTRQVDHFSQCILNNRTPDTPGEEGLADIRAIEAIYKAAGVPL
jgi:predicted dehydrogenase